MGTDTDTTPDTDGSRWLDATTARAYPAVAVVWAIAEPHRIGEVALLDGGGPWILGRGEGPRHLPFARQRPGATEPREPLASPRLSREQLVFERVGGELRVRNVGRRELLVNGRPAQIATLSPGDTIQVLRQIVLLVTERPAVLPQTRTWSLPLHPFGRPDPVGLVGESPAAWRLRDELAFAAPRAAHILVLGASGVGKELCARALHALSPRAARPLVGRSAVTMPETLIDAELFGNHRNFPNPGMPERAGLVGEADGSTLFLDEVGEVPETLQAHLLRVLDTGEYTRLGEARPRRADLRLVAATNRPLAALKHDLAARLEIRVEVPGLPDRREDIPLLVAHLMAELATDDAWIAEQYLDPVHRRPRLDPALVEGLLHHRYTHHIREVRAVLWRSMTESGGSYLRLTPGVATMLTSRARAPEELTAEEITAALDRNAGNRTATWKELGLRSRDQLYRLLKKHGLTEPTEPVDRGDP